MTKFEELCSFNVNEWTEKRKDGSTELTYLSWSPAWREFKKHYPDAKYEIRHFFNDESKMVLPYMYDKNTGYMVMTSITADGLTYEMWLPVMNSANKAMKSEPYTYQVKEYKGGRFTGNYIDKVVEAATMFDINKTIMRCLVKNMAMFGLGLYIYAGEDLPEQIDEGKTPEKPQEPLTPVEDKKGISNTIEVKTPHKEPANGVKLISIEQQIAMCENEDELKFVYQKNKAAIVSDAKLLNLCTQKGKTLQEKGAA